MSRLVPWILPWLLAGHVPAALATDLPSLIDPGELTGVREGVVTSLERQQPASIELKDEEAAARPAPVSAHPIRHIKLFGGSVYPAGEIAAILRPLVGTRPTTAQLQDALNRITERYRKDGYPLCYAYSPSAPDASGTLQVYLVEGHVVRLEVEAETPGWRPRCATWPRSCWKRNRCASPLSSGRSPSCSAFRAAPSGPRCPCRARSTGRPPCA